MKMPKRKQRTIEKSIYLQTVSNIELYTRCYSNKNTKERVLVRQFYTCFKNKCMFEAVVTSGVFWNIIAKEEHNQIINA